MAGFHRPMPPDTALVIVDLQCDFCEGGPLAVSGADQIIPIVNGLMRFYDTVVLTQDWHPHDHASFAPTPRYCDGSWPVHCVADTPGAAFPAALQVPPDAVVVRKGTLRNRDAYSGFQGTDLRRRLQGRGIQRLHFCGVATNYCVHATASDALRAGFEVSLLVDACRGVDLPPGAVQRALDAMSAQGVRLMNSNVVGGFPDDDDLS